MGGWLLLLAFFSSTFCLRRSLVDSAEGLRYGWVGGWVAWVGLGWVGLGWVWWVCGWVDKIRTASFSSTHPSTHQPTHPPTHPPTLLTSFSVAFRFFSSFSSSFSITS